VFQNVTLVPLGVAAETPNPSFIEMDLQRRLLFAVNEIAEFQSKPGGAVSAFSIDAAGNLTLLNQRPSMGARPCHLALDKEGRNLLVANCGSDSVAVLPVASGGQLGEATDVVHHTGKSVDPERQAGPHPLGVAFDPAGGYHRLFAHRSYRASAPLRLAYLLFGAAAVQNSALRWATDHRVHHAHTDEQADPYSIARGFWWAHMGWVLFHKPERAAKIEAPDLERDPLVAFQHRHYVPLAAVFGALLPAALGLLWGDPLGALLVVGFLRLALQWHVTFSINSFAHWIGRQPYCTDSSARDSGLTALISLGEGYHNFHHRFQSDYRNGVRWWHFDPTKWMVWSCSLVGLAHGLTRTPDAAVARARRKAGRRE
jgi:stearoyl-CoA desaturase (delta-9 desaturase)